jgi:ketosteroid isomerase-like protein
MLKLANYFSLQYVIIQTNSLKLNKLVQAVLSVLLIYGFKTHTMKQWTTIFLMSQIAFSVGCTAVRKEAQEKEAIKMVLINMWDAIEKKDMDRYAACLHPDFTQFGETDSVLQSGKNAEMNSMKAWLQKAGNVHTEMRDPVIVIRGSVAWITYYWSDAGINNGQPFTSRGKSTRLFVKENSQWLCIHGHYTLLP